MPVTSSAPSHPAWCDPRACTTVAHVRHSTAPDVLRTSHDDAVVSVAVERDDEASRDGWIRHCAGVALDVENLFGGPDGGPTRAVAFLTPDEADRVALRLIADAARAREAQ